MSIIKHIVLLILKPIDYILPIISKKVAVFTATYLIKGEGIFI